MTDVIFYDTIPPEVRELIIEYRDPPISYDRVTNRRKTSQIHFHYQHELYYLLRGETKYLVGDDIYHLRPGDFIFVPREVIHKTDSESCLQNERILLSFSDDVFDSQTRHILDEISSACLIHIPEEHLPLAESLLHKIQVEFEQNMPYTETLTKLYILELLTLLCRLKTASAPPKSESEKMIGEVAEYIRNHYWQDLPLCDLGQRFGLSESCLSRKFKAISGMGINEYITNVRVHNAEKLLSTGSYTVTQVAEKCGYSDSNYFASVFKKIKGITPLKYSKAQSWRQE